MGPGVVLATVPKTGSNFMKAVIGHDAFTTCDEQIERQLRLGHWTGLFRHVWAEDMAQIQYWARRLPLVAPMRHPRDVLVSWSKRPPKHQTLPWGGLQNYVDCFMRLFSLNPILVPLDTPDRDARLADMCVAIGRSCAVDWRPVNVNQRFTARALRAEEEDAAAEIARHPSLAAFGYADMKRAA